MNENFDEFDKYVLRYDLSVRMIEYKYKHSYRVVHQAEEICRSINLDTVERDLASNIALLHDIARFRQWTEYKTFNDQKSFDHGDEGVKILFDEGEIQNYIIDKDDYEIVKKAIYNHNKFDLDFSKLTDREALHCKIIRDADKIDIIHNVVDLGGIKLPEDNNGISISAAADFDSSKPVHHSHKSTKNDSTLVMIAFVFDLNFDYSYEYFKKHKFVNKIYKKLDDKKLFKPYIDKANNYVEGKCKDAKCKILAQGSRRK